MNREADGQPQPGFVLLEVDQSAEAIVAEPNPVLMTDRVVVGSGTGEGSCEGLNDEQLEYNLSVSERYWVTDSLRRSGED